ERILEGCFEVELREDWKLDPDHRRDLLDAGARGDDEPMRRDRRAPTCDVHMHPIETISLDAEARHAPAQQARAMVPSALEQVHAQLLPAEPAAAARVQNGANALRQIAEVFAN